MKVKLILKSKNEIRKFEEFINTKFLYLLNLDKTISVKEFSEMIEIFLNKNLIFFEKKLGEFEIIIKKLEVDGFFLSPILKIDNKFLNGIDLLTVYIDFIVKSHLNSESSYTVIKSKIKNKNKSSSSSISSISSLSVKSNLKK